MPIVRKKARVNIKKRAAYNKKLLTILKIRPLICLERNGIKLLRKFNLALQKEGMLKPRKPAAYKYDVNEVFSEQFYPKRRSLEEILEELDENILLNIWIPGENDEEVINRFKQVVKKEDLLIAIFNKQRRVIKRHIRKLLNISKKKKKVIDELRIKKISFWRKIRGLKRMLKRNQNTMRTTKETLEFFKNSLALLNCYLDTKSD